MTKIIAFAGMTNSGKSLCVKYCEDKHWPIIHFGNMVYEEVERRGLSIVEYEAEVREDMRAKEGKEVLAKRVSAKADKLVEAGQEVVVLDGLYSWSEYKFLSEKYDSSFFVIAVIAPKQLRYNWAINRKDPRRTYTKEDVALRDLQEIENIEKGGPIAAADYYLLNNGTVDDLYDQLEKVLQEILNEDSRADA